VITLDFYQQQLQRDVRKIIEDNLRQGRFELPDNLLFSALGARICYSSDSVESLLQDKRIIDFSYRLEFLRRCAQRKHFSVFAHSPVAVDYAGVADLEPLQRLFKTFPYRDGGRLYICLNARHLVEFTEFDNLLSGFTYLSLYQKTLDLDSSRRVHLLTFEDPFYPYGWLVIIAEGFSRVFSHQFVRHTWLNFNQRSHRYTRVDDVFLPAELTNSNEVKGLIAKVFTVYNHLIEKGVRREDARYLIPCGARTTILASGPLLSWQDFLSKRLGKDVQRETREFALAVEQLISDSPYKIWR